MADHSERLREIQKHMDLNPHLEAIRKKTRLWSSLEDLSIEQLREEWTTLAGLFSEMDAAIKAGARLPNDWRGKEFPHPPKPVPAPPIPFRVPEDPTHDPR